ncbi:MAG: L-rhamnose mutarotase, partial [Bacteroidota bacterium]
AVHYLSESNDMAALPHTTIMKNWWAYMGDIMDANPDNSPVVKPLKMVFHME